jgi:hypothetical protein
MVIPVTLKKVARGAVGFAAANPMVREARHVT